jgi:hypothetical protein
MERDFSPGGRGYRLAEKVDREIEGPQNRRAVRTCERMLGARVSPAPVLVFERYRQRSGRDARAPGMLSQPLRHASSIEERRPPGRAT